MREGIIERTDASHLNGITASDIEIMAPVGSYESLMAAIQGNADSVYFGVGHLNMRARSSQNFTIDDLVEITRICREHGIKTYLTVNTIIYDRELEDMHQTVDAAKKHGISAIIATDISVIQYARSIGMEVHISTQSNITNIEAVKFWSQFADVMVTARELNLRQVYDITESIKEQKIKGPSGNLVQIEIFAHGALCMAVSGKCYLSLDNMNSSANRGSCLQPCRRGYKVSEMGGDYEFQVDNEYIMSPKDLKTIDFLDKILMSGVRVLKIEGRGRSPEYVKTVAKTYRDAVDAWFANEFTAEKLIIWNEQLRSVYNRGFWDGYYLGKKMGEWTQQYGSLATKRKTYIGKISNYFSKIGVAEIKLEAQSLKIGEDIRILGPNTGVYEDQITEIRHELQTVNSVSKGEVFSIPVKTLVRRGDKVYKVIDADALDLLEH